MSEQMKPISWLGFLKQLQPKIPIEARTQGMRLSFDLGSRVYNSENGKNVCDQEKLSP